MAKSNFLLLVVLVVCTAPLASCSGVKVPEKVPVPMPVACVPLDKRPQPPAVRSEADLLAMPQGLRTLAAWSDLKKYEIYAAQAEAIIEGCSRIPRQ